MTITIKVEGSTIDKATFVTQDEHKAWECLQGLTDPWRPGTHITIEVTE